MRGVWIEIPGELSPLTNSSLGSTFEQYLLDEYLFERLNKTIKLRGNTFVQPSLEVIVFIYPKKVFVYDFPAKRNHHMWLRATTYVLTLHTIIVRFVYDSLKD